ncbi:MAG: hypothetical protein Q9182_003895 [Xanthomendoza sp. 2 TL-2023]
MRQYLKPPLKQNARSDGRLRIVDETLDTFDINQDSIICMLIWKDQANPTTAAPKLSLYSGGDAEWVMEDNLAAWIDTKVEVLKVGHHGSLAGTSKEFVEKLGPQHVLLSAGDDHNHPVPEWILYFRAHFNFVSGLPPAKRIHSVCYPYNLGYVKDPAYFNGIRFFVSKHKFTSRFNALPATPPTGAGDLLFYNFFMWLQTIDPGPINEIRQRMTDAKAWFDADESETESWKAVVKAQKAKYDTALAAWQAKGSRIKGPEFKEKEEQKKIYESMSDASTYQGYFNVNFISWVVANCWEELSLVDNQWYPTGVDKDTVTQSKAMHYQHVQFFSNASPTIQMVPEPTKRAAVGRQPLMAVKKAKTNLNARSARQADPPSIQQVQVPSVAVNPSGGARGRKRGAGTPMQPITFTRAQYILSLEHEARIKRVEYDVKVDEVEEDDVDYGVNVSLQSKRGNLAIVVSASTLTQFQSIVPTANAVSGSAILLQNSEDQQNAYYFLKALQDASIILSTPTSVSKTWSAVVSDNDATYQWFWAFLSANGAASNISITISGETDIDAETNSQIALITDIGLSFFIGNTTTSMTLKSSSVAAGFNVDSLADIVDSYGFMENGTGIMFGISAQASSESEFTLADLLRLVGIQDSLLDGSTLLQLSMRKQGVENLPDPMNVLFYLPQNNNKIILTVSAQAATASEKGRLIGLAYDIPGCTFTNSTILVTKSGYSTSAYVSDSGSSEPEEYVCSVGSLCLQSKVSLGDSAKMTCQCWIGVGNGSLSLTLQWAKLQSPSINDFLTWVAESAGISYGTAWSDFENICGDILGSLHLREASLVASKADDSWNFAADFSITFEVDLGSGWGLDDAEPVPIMLTFEYKSSDTSGDASSYIGFRGNMWTQITDDIVAADRLSPDAPLVPRLTPLPDAPQYAIDLLSLGGVDKASLAPLARLFPTLITALSFEISNQDVAFSGTMIADPDVGFSRPDGTAPFLAFDEVKISASYTYPSASSGKHLEFRFDALIVLNPRGPDPAYSAGLEVSIDYDNGSWTFEGMVTDLNVGCLYSLFPPQENDAIMNVMEEIAINELSINYAYSGATTSTITAEGTLTLGPVSLQIDYAFDGHSRWKFSASLGIDFTGGKIVLGDFLSGVCADLVNLLPDFVYDTEFRIASQTNRDDNATPPIRLLCEKSGDFLVLSIAVEANGFDFYYVQLTESTSNQGTKTPKRLLRFEMESLPDVDSVPLLTTLAQPFDQMDLLWVSDDLTKGEVEFLNTEVFTRANEKLICKPAVTPNSDVAKQNSDMVLAKGSHFMVIAEESNVPTAVLDYVFGGTPTRPAKVNSSRALESFNEDPIVRDDMVTSPAPTGAATAPWTKTIGPLTIASIGLKYLDKKLQITLDITVKVGGVEVKFKGFGLRFPMESASSFVRDLNQIDLLLDGMGISLNSPPLFIAGIMQRIPTGYAGGIMVEFEPYAFLAMGAYMTITETKVMNGITAISTFKSILVLLSASGPIAELELASLDGLTGGYGQNSEMRMPSIDEVTAHPFLASSQITAPGANGDMLATMSSLTTGSKPWFSPKNGTTWVAGGLTAGLLSTLDVDAVLALEVGDDVKISIFADCQAAIPKAAINDSERFAFVELGLLMILDYAKGAFTCQGQLSPKSYILDKNCHLTGGFALCYWFEGSGHEGDWVFTIGGYHSQFKPPTWYPRPPRLAIDWKYDDTISIHGEAYFAITPKTFKVCMGGGRLAFVFQDGSIAAHLEAWADFLINYKPFMFATSIGVNVGASYTFKHWGITKKASVSLGCSLELHGPPVAGKVKVDWYIISFTIHFGDSHPNSTAIDWPGFVALLVQDPASAAKTPSIDPLHTLATTAGVLQPETNNPPPAYWTVDASTFAFRFASLFPIRNVYDSQNKKQYTSDKPAPFMKPMHIPASVDVTSDVIISITNAQNADISDFFTLSPIIKKVPTAIWGAYDSAKDPSNGARPSSLLTTGDATMDQVMGFDLGPCTTTESTDIIQLDIANECSEDVFANALNPPFLPTALSIPLTLPDPATGSQTPLNSSVDPSQSQYASCVSQRTSWIPDFQFDNASRADRLDLLFKYGIEDKEIGVRDIVDSWIAFKGLDPSDEMGSGGRYKSLRDSARGLDVVCRPFEENGSLPPPRVAVGAVG